jgi:hypothetical protein
MSNGSLCFPLSSSLASASDCLVGIFRQIMFQTRYLLKLIKKSKLLTLKSTFLKLSYEITLNSASNFSQSCVLLIGKSGSKYSLLPPFVRKEPIVLAVIMVFQWTPRFCSVETLFSRLFNCYLPSGQQCATLYLRIKAGRGFWKSQDGRWLSHSSYGERFVVI